MALELLNPNCIDWDTILKDRNNMIKYLRRVRPEMEDVPALLALHGYNAEEEYFLIAGGYMPAPSKYVNLPKPTRKQVSNIKKQIDLLHYMNDSWITVAHINYALVEDGWHQYHYNQADLLSAVLKCRDLKTSTYMSINEFYRAKRTYLTLRYLTALYCEIDAHDEVEFNYRKTKAFLDKKVKDKVIPPYTMSVKSGRGLQIYWKIEVAPATILWLWQTLQSAIVEALADISEKVGGHKIDMQCVDPTRVFRIVETFNPKADKFAELVECNDKVYKMNDMLVEYFPHKIKKKRARRESTTPISEQNLTIIDSDGNEYNVVDSNAKFKRLRQNRCADFQKLMELRKDKIQQGHRNYFLWVYSWTVIERFFTEDRLISELMQVNMMFNDPITEDEVVEIAQRTFGQFTKKIKLNAKENTLSDRLGRFTFLSETIIANLEITAFERSHFCTILTNEEAKAKHNEIDKAKKKAARRDENGMTARAREYMNNKMAVKNLLDDGCKQVEIVAKTGLSKSRVSEICKVLRAENV